MGPQGAQGESDRAQVSTLKVEFLKSAHVGPVGTLVPYCLGAVLPYCLRQNNRHRDFCDLSVFINNP